MKEEVAEERRRVEVVERKVVVVERNMVEGIVKVAVVEEKGAGAVVELAVVAEERDNVVARVVATIVGERRRIAVAMGVTTEVRERVEVQEGELMNMRRIVNELRAGGLLESSREEILRPGETGRLEFLVAPDRMPFAQHKFAAQLRYNYSMSLN
ncbi:hypothetical protein C7212DRAFT_343472 [Tuber magnatum]|uniref:Uncharacterized protein n=1 Tax=Tuber magnatum TaxID=42249 RepID=A0A317SUG9_9PEZI|nr:hypothetical protein C7212DRAFT_343472 [Tuber magnatum]